MLVHALLVSALAAAPPFQVPAMGPLVQVTETASRASATRALDIDADGDLDLVLLDSSSNEVLWLEAMAPGDFAPPAVLVRLVSNATRAAGSLDAALFDLDGDGSTELVVSEARIPRLLSFPRTGPASFGGGVTLASTTTPVNVVVAVDLDQDGDQDLVAGGNLGSPGTWFLENTGGQLAAPFRLGDGGRLIEPADFDLDGDLDLFTASSTGAFYALTNGGGASSFSSTAIAFSNYTFDLAVGDIDGDGVVDAAISGQAPYSVRTFLGDGFGAFHQDASVYYALYHNADARIELLDLDGDADLDIAIAPLNREWVDWFENVGAGAFAAQQSQRLIGHTATGFFTRADLDLDGHQDLVSVGGSGVVQAALTGATGQPVAFTELTRRWEAIEDAVVLDADGDGDLDIAVSSEREGSGIAWNDGTGAFSFPEAIAGFTGASVPEVERVGAADVNGDGRADLIHRTRHGSLLLSLQSTPGSFLDPVTIGTSSGGTPRTIDFDLNGHTDVVAEARNPERLLGYAQLAGGTFSGVVTLTELFGRPIAYATRDVDRDGSVDFITYEDGPSGVPNEFRVYYGNPGGGFTAGVTVPSPQFATPNPHVLFEDVDGDGLVDVLYSGGFGQATTIWWTRNLGARQFASAQEVGNVGYSVLRLELSRPVPGGAAVLAVAASNGFGAETYLLFEITAGNHLGPLRGTGIFGSGTCALIFADLGTGAEDLVIADQYLSRLGVAQNQTFRDVGTVYCGPAQPNSTGEPGEIAAYGTDAIAAQRFDLVATHLPPGATTFFLASLDAGFAANPAGSAGNLCLGGAIGRLNQAGLVGAANAQGAFRRPVDLTAIPQPTGAIMVLPQSVWHFQAWHRDQAVGGGATSNFTDALSVMFR